MEPVTPQQIDNLRNAMERYTGSIGDYARGLREKQKNDRKWRDDFDNKARGAAKALGALGGSADNAYEFFKNLGRGGLIGGAFAGLLKVGNDMTDTYRELVNHGQSFNGSILEMSITAAAAGMPLKEFKDAVIKSSKVVARMGARDFANLNRSINESMMAVGMFALTQEQLTDHMSHYLETTRRMGIVGEMTTSQLSNGFMGLMEETTALSRVTGVAREQITQLAQSSIQSSMAMSRIAMLSTQQGIRANQQLMESVTILASQAGEAGQFLAGLRAETFGMGQAAFTEQGRQLISVGMGHLATMFEGAMSGEDTVVAMERFRQEVGQNIPLLRSLALGTGESAANARQLLAVHSQMVPLTREQLRQERQRARDQDGITKLFTTFRTAWNLVTGSFREGFLKGFRPLFQSVGDFTKSHAFKRIQEIMKSLGEQLGVFIAGILSRENLSRVGQGLKKLGEFLFDTDWAAFFAPIWAMFKGLWGIVKSIGSFVVGLPWDAIVTTVGALATVFGFFATLVAGVVNTLSQVPGLLESMIVVLGAFVAWRRLSRLFRNDMVVNANNVFINGDIMGGDGGGGGGGGRRRRWGGRGRPTRGGGHGRSTRGQSRADRLRSINARRAAVGRGRLGGIGGAARGLGRRVPGLNALLYGGEIATTSGAARTSAIGGAVGGIGGGLAGAAAGAAIGSVVPVVGTAIGGIIGGLIGGFGGDLLGRSAASGMALSGGGARGGRGLGAARLAMMAGGVGLAGYGAYSMLGGGEEAGAASDKADEMLTQLKDLNRKIEVLNTNLVAFSRNVASNHQQEMGALRGVARSS